MSVKSEIHKAYELRMIQKAHTRLSRRIDIDALPFSQDELSTLVKRSREYHLAYGSDSKLDRLAKYKEHLSELYGDELVTGIWEALEKINNEIGYEEK